MYRLNKIHKFRITGDVITTIINMKYTDLFSFFIYLII